MALLSMRYPRLQNCLLAVGNGWVAVERLGVSQERVDHCVDDLVEEQLRQMGVERRVELEGHLVDNIRCHIRVVSLMT